MKIVVFAGPTLPAGQIREALALDGASCEVLPPAARGDVLAASLGSPNVIVLIDGYFDRVPSVWHKEVLWCLTQGIHVWGASSMGALRAAELADFGMVGIGAIYEDYRSGVLTADDAVAVAHGDAPSGYRSASDALVNIRATLHAARAAGIVDDEIAQELLNAAAAMPYWERTYHALLKTCSAAGGESAASRLEAWLREGRIDQKAADARSLCERLSASYGDLSRPFRAGFAFSATDAWCALRADVEARANSGSSSNAAYPDLWLDELLVDRDWPAVLAGALSRAVAERGAGPSRVADDAVRAVAADFRRERGLYSAEQFEAWLAEQGLVGTAAVDAFFRSEAVLRRTLAAQAQHLRKHLLQQLRSDGRLGELVKRGERKLATLRRHGMEDPSLRGAALSEPELWRWYFTQLRGISAPESLAPTIQGIDTGTLRRAVLKEYCYLQIAGAPQ